MTLATKVITAELLYADAQLVLAKAKTNKVTLLEQYLSQYFEDGDETPRIIILLIEEKAITYSLKDRTVIIYANGSSEPYAQLHCSSLEEINETIAILDTFLSA